MMLASTTIVISDDAIFALLGIAASAMFWPIVGALWPD